MKILEWTGEALIFLDQSKLPQQEEAVVCRDLECVCEAIKNLRIRGAPALGVTAAYAFLLGAKNLRALGEDSLFEGLEQVTAAIKSTRPTAVNLFWGVEEMRRTAFASKGGGVAMILETLERRAREIEADNAARHRTLSELGAEVVGEHASILHHCETGPLATIDYGSALGVIHAAHRHGKAVHVFVDETRPLLQGARLTCWTLQSWGIPFTLITDGMAGYFMRRGRIDAVIVGADRIAANGDVANKIGTYSVAVLAAHHRIPFFVAAPLTTIDFTMSTGDRVQIEERNPDEVRGFRGNIWAPKDAPVANPAFDVTPAELVTGIITEAGIARPPSAESLAKLRSKSLVALG